MQSIIRTIIIFCAAGGITTTQLFALLSACAGPAQTTSVLFNNQQLDGLKRFLLKNRQDQFVRAMVYKITTFAFRHSSCPPMEARELRVVHRPSPTVRERWPRFEEKKKRKKSAVIEKKIPVNNKSKPSNYQATKRRNRMLNRLNTCYCIAMVLLACFTASPLIAEDEKAAVASEGKSNRPNIIFFFTDDHALVCAFPATYAA